MDVVGVPADKFEQAFPLIEWHFKSFAERSRGEATVENLKEQVRSKDSQCWLVWDGKVRACALTRVLADNIKVIEMTHCAGDGREDWQEALVNEIRAWAKATGGHRFRTVNRPGWTKALRNMGLKETHRVMEQDL